jgi:16S rRNA (cytosine1402-N4)-methyltransferase
MTPPVASARHIPVLGREVIAWLEPVEGGIYVDATFGAGGYSRAILDINDTRVIGIDRDRSAIAGGFELVDRSNGRLTLVASPTSPKSAYPEVSPRSTAS